MQTLLTDSAHVHVQYDIVPKGIDGAAAIQNWAIGTIVKKLAGSLLSTTTIEQINEHDGRQT